MLHDNIIWSDCEYDSEIARNFQFSVPIVILSCIGDSNLKCREVIKYDTNFSMLHNVLHQSIQLCELMWYSTICIVVASIAVSGLPMSNGCANEIDY